MNVYSIDLKIAATAYIRAETEEAAEKIARANIFMTEASLENIGFAEISNEQFDSPDLPEFSVSPCCTVHGPWLDEDDAANAFPVYLVE